MWRPRPPGWLWLVRHELRVGWRGTGAVRSRVLAALGIVVIVLAHFAAWQFMRAFDLDAVLARAAPAVILATIFFVLFMLSSAFAIATQVIWMRGDLDLLLSSPVPATHVYAARGIWVALGAVATVALFVLPLANTAPLHGHWGALATYPVLAATGLACAAFAFATTFALVRLVGIRRARVFSQVTGALVGAALVLAMQAQAFLPRSAREQLALWAASDTVAWWLSAQSPLTWPVRALFGEPASAIGLVAAGVALYALAIRATAPSFVSVTQRAPEGAKRAVPGEPSRRAFRTGLARIVIAKELTLLARDPSLIGRALLQVIYLVPLFLVMLRQSQPPALLAAALVMISMSLAGTLAWMTVSGEEAPDLLGSAPVSIERTRWLKAAAALIPVAALALPFIAGFAMQSLRSTALLVACLAGGLVSSAVVQVWSTTPRGKRDLRIRYRGNVLLNLAELLSSAGWAFACYLAITDTGGTPWAIALGLVAPASAWAVGRRRRE